MGWSRLSRAALIYLSTSSTAFAFSLNPHHLLESRATGCSNSADIPCNQGLPSNFCCGSSTTCIALAGNTTAICCPNGQSCNVIQPVSCDIQLQNATTHPDNALKTVDLSGVLPTCGSLCCPFGYSCSGNTTCIENSNQSLKPGESPPVSSASAASTLPISSATPKSTISSTSSTHPTSVPGSIATSTTGTQTTPNQKCNSFPAAAVLAGFFPGLILGILFSILFIYLLGRHRRRQAKRMSNTSSFGAANVSEPIYDSASAVRTDFLRKEKDDTAGENMTGGRLARSPTFRRMKGFVRKSMGGGAVGYTNRDPMTAIPRRAPAPPTTQNRPQTPPTQRATSGVSINVFASSDISSIHSRPHSPGGGLGTPTPAPLRNTSRERERESHQTNVDDFVNAGRDKSRDGFKPDFAGLRKGEPFVQQPVGHYTGMHERKGSGAVGRDLLRS